MDYFHYFLLIDLLSQEYRMSGRIVDTRLFNERQDRRQNEFHEITLARSCCWSLNVFLLETSSPSRMSIRECFIILQAVSDCNQVLWLTSVRELPTHAYRFETEDSRDLQSRIMAGQTPMREELVTSGASGESRLSLLLEENFSLSSHKITTLSLSSRELCAKEALRYFLIFEWLGSGHGATKLDESLTQVAICVWREGSIVLFP